MPIFSIFDTINNMKKIYIFVTVFALLAIVLITVVGMGEVNQGPTACTMEAKICPDGSAVGRTGPNCEFSECPIVMPSAVQATNDIILGVGETGNVGDINITVNNITQDSRCPRDVQCVWAGAFQAEVVLVNDLKKETKVMTLGAPAYLFAGRSISLSNITPYPSSKTTVNPNDYAITFHVVTNVISYTNASADLIEVVSPLPGAIVGNSFSITGQARGTYYFEASFPVVILGASDEVLVQTYATAQEDWMTENFVPFRADITLPGSYGGPAKILLKKDNPSGLSEHDATTSFDVVIE